MTSPEACSSSAASPSSAAGTGAASCGGLWGAKLGIADSPDTAVEAAKGRADPAGDALSLA